MRDARLDRAAQVSSREGAKEGRRTVMGVRAWALSYSVLGDEYEREDQMPALR